jgi:hypothetical protein
MLGDIAIPWMQSALDGSRLSGWRRDQCIRMFKVNGQKRSSSQARARSEARDKMTMPIPLTKTLPNTAGWYICQHYGMPTLRQIVMRDGKPQVRENDGSGTVWWSNSLDGCLWSERLEIQDALHITRRGE